MVGGRSANGQQGRASRARAPGSPPRAERGMPYRSRRPAPDAVTHARMGPDGGGEGVQLRTRAPGALAARRMRGCRGACGWLPSTTNGFARRRSKRGRVRRRSLEAFRRATWSPTASRAVDSGVPPKAPHTHRTRRAGERGVAGSGGAALRRSGGRSETRRDPRRPSRVFGWPGRAVRLTIDALRRRAAQGARDSFPRRSSGRASARGDAARPAIYRPDWRVCFRGPQKTPWAEPASKVVLVGERRSRRPARHAELTKMLLTCPRTSS